MENIDGMYSVKEIYLLSAYAYVTSEENEAREMMVTSLTCGAS